MNDHIKALTRGALLSVTLRWFIKAIGLISTIILARFLTPADYGVLVMATLVIGLVEIFFFSAADTALLRNTDSSDALVNSAWTLRLIQAAVVTVIVACLTPAAAAYFRDERIIPVMLILSVGTLFSAFGNIGPVLARKNLEFGLEVKIGIGSKSISFVITVLAAYFLRSYWALVIGTYAGHISGVWLSYSLHPYRPKWNITRIRELWSFSQWLLISSIGNFFGRKLDELILGRIGTAKDLGIYNVASEIGQTVTVEISAPVNRSLFPVLSNMQRDKPASLNLFFSTLGIINTFTIPAGIGMALVASAFVQVVLGISWLSVIPILEIFAIQGSIRFLVSPYYVWFMVSNKGRILALMSWLEICCFLVFVAFTYKHGVLGLAWARLLTTLVMVAAWIVLGHFESLSVRSLFKTIFRPLVASIAMLGGLLQLRHMLVFINPYAELVVSCAVGAFLYGLALAVIWVALGRPDGIEKTVLRRTGLIS